MQMSLRVGDWVRIQSLVPLAGKFLVVVERRTQYSPVRSSQSDRSISSRISKFPVGALSLEKQFGGS